MPDTMPRTRMTLFPALGAVLLASGSCGPREAGGAGPAAPAPPAVLAPTSDLRYQAEIEVGNGEQTSFARVLRDGRRFRVERLHRSDDPAPHRIETCDGTDPHLVLEYFPERKLAAPTLESSLGAFSAAVARLGPEEACRRYRVPLSSPEAGRPAPAGPPEPDPGLTRFAPMPGLPVAPAGHETVAGFACEIREQTRATRSPELETRIRSWVEPRTGLVLRREVHTSYPETSPLPPRRAGFRVSRLRLDPDCAAGDFAPPPGTRVRLPEIFAEARLPAGLPREPYPGAGSGIGVAF